MRAAVTGVSPRKASRPGPGPAHLAAPRPACPPAAAGPAGANERAEACPVSPPAPRRRGPARRPAPAEARGAEERRRGGEPPARRCGSGWAGSRCCPRSETGRFLGLGAGRAPPARRSAGRAGEPDGLAGRSAAALAEGGGFPPSLPSSQLRLGDEEEGARAAPSLLPVVGTCRM